MSEEFTLAEVIKHTAEQLRLVKQNEEADPVMKLQDCEIELCMAASAQANAGIKFYFVDAGGKIANQNTTTVRLRFSTEGILAKVESNDDAEDIPTHEDLKY